MAFAVIYNSQDNTIIQACYQAARPILSNNDRQNIDGCWAAGLNTYDTTAALAFTGVGGEETDPTKWHARCKRPDGTVDYGLCDVNTRIVTVNGTWARGVAAYGAVQGQPITLAGFVGLMRRMVAADTDVNRRGQMDGIVDDIARYSVTL